jgi:hypothetical protein
MFGPLQCVGLFFEETRWGDPPTDYILREQESTVKHRTCSGDKEREKENKKLQG